MMFANLHFRSIEQQSKKTFISNSVLIYQLPTEKIGRLKSYTRYQTYIWTNSAI